MTMNVQRIVELGQKEKHGKFLKYVQKNNSKYMGAGM